MTKIERNKPLAKNNGDGDATKKINNGNTIKTLMMVMQQEHKNFNDVSFLAHNNHHNKNETNKLT
jgi:hypothetical protein